MAKEKFVLVSLKEDSAKKLANVIGNDTSRRILDALAEGDHTESELAKKLELPLSTVHYNLSHLRKARLVEVEEFHYSSKGREVNHYRLANKFIIIAPKEPASMDKLKEKLQRILPVSAIMIAAAWFIGWGNRVFSNGGTFGAAKDMAAVTESAAMPLRAATDIAADEAVSRAAAAPAEVIQAVAPSLSLTDSFAFWFVIGGIAALVLYVLVDMAIRRIARGKE